MPKMNFFLLIQKKFVPLHPLSQEKKSVFFDESYSYGEVGEWLKPTVC